MTLENTSRESFLALHVPGNPLLLPNPWDIGSAKLFESLGFRALATTSSGFAASIGRRDGHISRAAALGHAQSLAEATNIPVTADLENGFGDEPDEVAETVAAAVGAGLAGCSIEDYAERREPPVYERALAVERVRAAAEVAHRGRGLVLTARAENHIRGITDLDDTIARLQGFQDAGADVLYAPGLTSAVDIRSVVQSVDRPVNVLARPGMPSLAELARAGVARISVGGAFEHVAYAAVAACAEDMLEDGSFGYFDDAQRGRALLERSLGK